METQPPLVSICCITYNHAPYIRECLEGFLMQKTNFAFEILLYDDASTDMNQDIIREYHSKYPNLIKPILQKENQYSKGVKVGSFNFDRAQGKYIALCEGDDYWIDPGKLQKQVDFLENNPECGMVCTDVKRYIQQTGIFMDSKIIPFDIAGYDDVMDWHDQIATLTVCFRKSLLGNDPELDSDQFFLGDVFRFIQVSLTHSIKFLPDITGVYRVLPNSASHFNNKIAQTRFTYRVSNTFLWFLAHYPLKDPVKHRYLVNKHRMAVFAFAKVTGNYALAQSVKFDFPRKLHSGYSLIYIESLLCKNKWVFDRISQRASQRTIV